MEERLGLRFALLALAIFALLAALWAGLIRLGWVWPILQPGLIRAHGPLMVSGFLGTLISLERCIALRRRWMYAGPLMSGLGALLLIGGVNELAGQVLITLSSVWLVAIFVIIVRQHRALYTLVMAFGAWCWAAGNILWLAGMPIHRVVLWWAAFLILTIAGERLELGRLLRLSRRVESLFIIAIGLLLAGLVATLPAFNLGTRLAGVSFIALAVWLLRYDIARRTVLKTGLPRYAAVCLLGGYLWLGISGLLMLVYGVTAAGPLYDAVLHSIFLGFVISMIFGHAPIIFPAILKTPIHYTPVFYTHLILLHLSLLLRVAGDLVFNPPLRLWGGLLNTVAILVFLFNTLHAVIRTRHTNLRAEEIYSAK
jgi:hypothetical protein